MNLTITIIAALMVIDSAFTLVNLSRVESFIQRAFPDLNVKKVAVVEGVAGFIVIVIKVITHSLI